MECVLGELCALDLSNLGLSGTIGPHLTLLTALSGLVSIKRCYVVC
jgi:hypothetical protein